MGGLFLYFEGDDIRIVLGLSMFSAELPSCWTDLVGGLRESICGYGTIRGRFHKRVRSIGCSSG